MTFREDVIRISAACAAGFLVCSSLPAFLRAGPALLLVLYLPGAGIVAAVVGRRKPDSETMIMSVGLSFAACGLSSLVLNSIHMLNEIGWAAALTSVSLAGSIAALLQDKGSLPHTQAALALPPLRRVVLWSMASILAVGAVTLAAKGAMSQREFRFTNFWIVPSPTTMASQAVVGVRNEEGRSVRYMIEIVSRGALTDVPSTFTLAPGEARTFTLALPTVVFTPSPEGVKPDESRHGNKAVADRVEARLFKDGDRSTVYRHVWLAVPPAVKSNMPASNRAQAGSAMSFGDVAARPLRLPSAALDSHVESVESLRAPSAAIKDKITFGEPE